MRRRLNAFAFISILFAGLFLISGCKHAADILPQLPGSWTAIANPPGQYYNVITTGSGIISNSEYSAPIDSMYFSADHFSSWSSVLPADSSQFSILVDLFNNMHVVAYSSGKSTFYVSQNGGQTWTVLNHLSANFLMPDTAYNQLSETVFLAVSNNRFFMEKYNYSSVGSQSVQVLLMRSDNFGNTWDTFSNQTYLTPYSPVVQLVRVGNNLLEFATGQMILSSQDNGSTWGVINYHVPAGLGYYGLLSNGTLVGMSDNGYDICLSHDTSKIWADVFNNNSPGWGSGSMALLAFDSVLLEIAYYPNSWHVLCSTASKLNWFEADAGIGSIGYSSQTGLFIDNEYVYAYIDGFGFYRRPRSDFKGI